MPYRATIPMQPLRFVVGKIERRVLGAPRVRGFLGAEDGPSQPGTFALDRVAGGLRLGIPGTDVVTLSGDLARQLDTGTATSVLIAWPEIVVVVRAHGVVIAGEGDILHFGALALDQQRTLRRVGFSYLAAEGSAVEPRLELTEHAHLDAGRAMRRGGFQRAPTATASAKTAASASLATSGAARDTLRLPPGESVSFGPYRLENVRSFDHERRPLSGVAGHAYFFKLARQGEEPMHHPNADWPDPFSVTDARPLLDRARRLALVHPDEIVSGEPAAAQLEFRQRYDGAPGLLERGIMHVGPSRPTVRFHGDELQVLTARVFRGPQGTVHVGRLTLHLPQVGSPWVTRHEGEHVVPGRVVARAAD